MHSQKNWATFSPFYLKFSIPLTHFICYNIWCGLFAIIDFIFNAGLIFHRKKGHIFLKWSFYSWLLLFFRWCRIWASSTGREISLFLVLPCPQSISGKNLSKIYFFYSNLTFAQNYLQLLTDRMVEAISSIWAKSSSFAKHLVTTRVYMLESH